MNVKHILRRIASTSAVALALLSAGVTDSSAAASDKDIQIIGKALSFISGGPSGDVAVDIIFDPSNPASVSDADAVASLLSAGVASGKITLSGAKTASSTGAKVAYIAAGAEGKASALSGQGIITVSSNPECAKSSGCVLGVSTSPKVEIHVGKAAAESAGAAFGSAFRMMIIEH